MKRLIFVFLCFTLIFAGCEEIGIWVPVQGGQITPPGPDDDPEKKDDDQTPSDTDNVISIVWSAEGAEVTNKTGIKVETKGGHVVVGTPEAEGKKLTISLSGTSTDGSLKVYNGVKAQDTNKKLTLKLDNLNLTSTVGPAVNIQTSKTVTIQMTGNSSLTDGTSYTGVEAGEDAKACLFAEEQLVFEGSGKLEITGRYRHAVASDDYVLVSSGELVVKSAVLDGIHANDYVKVEGGTVNITSTEECIQCEDELDGSFTMTDGTLILKSTASRSGAIETSGDITIEGGSLQATVGGTAAKCLKSDKNITIKGGELTLTTTGNGIYDSTERDTVSSACIKADGTVSLEGGNITCKSSGTGGKGINCSVFQCKEPTVLKVNTTGAKYSYSSSMTSYSKAIKATNGVVIDGGDIVIETTQSGAEGVESKTNFVMNGGALVITAKDDAINASQTLTFNGGYVFAYSNGNDAIDSNYGRANAIVVDGAVVIAHSQPSPEEGFDADNHAYLTFKSGYILSTGGQQGGGGGGFGGGRPGGGGTTGSNPVCSQSCMMYSGAASAGYFILADTSGKVIMSCYVPRAQSSSYIMFSAPLTAGQQYKCGFSTSAPSGASVVFDKYFYKDGTFTGTLSKSFSAPSGYSSI